MVHCCVPFCNSDSSQKTGTSFHEFPSDIELRQQWISAIKRQVGKGRNAKPWVPGEGARVCSIHFQQTDYKQGCKIRCLIRGAVPSIFEGYPSYMKPPSKCSRRPLIRHSLLQHSLGKRIEAALFAVVGATDSSLVASAVG